ncbi:hypothetical protein EK21DRAFT_108174 [Setomelanomma holmii]|uniref:Uncharacterized protein n=1 Tax=Setomelanomma holmii TaxID=210430 RepID=A0A9P4HJH5_9PLEO|nr:hypothetical protein EK21DRAFT_108174 [Setomelanomma holmii]
MAEKMLKDTVSVPSGMFTSFPESLEYSDLLDDFVVRFHRDRFEKLAGLKTSSSATPNRPLEEMLCGVCSDFHPSSFSPTEVAKGPHDIACKVALAKIYLCTHQQLSYIDLLRKLRTQDDTPPPGILQLTASPICQVDGCDVQLHADPRGVQSSPFEVHTQRRITVPASMRQLLEKESKDVREWHKVMYPDPLHTLANGEFVETKAPPSLVTMSPKFVRTALNYFDIYICSHLRSSNPAIFEAFRQDANNVFDLYHTNANLRDERINSVWPARTTGYRCKAVGCETMCSTEWESTTRQLVIVVIRPFDYCMMTDLKWQAKTKTKDSY